MGNIGQNINKYIGKRISCTIRDRSMGKEGDGKEGGCGWGEKDEEKKKR